MHWGLHICPFGRGGGNYFCPEKKLILFPKNNGRGTSQRSSEIPRGTRTPEVPPVHRGKPEHLKISLVVVGEGGKKPSQEKKRKRVKIEGGGKSKPRRRDGGSGPLGHGSRFQFLYVWQGKCLDYQVWEKGQEKRRGGFLGEA